MSTDRQKNAASANVSKNGTVEVVGKIGKENTSKVGAAHFISIRDVHNWKAFC